MKGHPAIDELRALDSLVRGAPLGGFIREALVLRREGFGLAVLFTNSWRTALFALLAGAPRRAGYRRMGRSLLLSDRLEAPRAGGRYEPSPMIDYYINLVRLIGVEPASREMSLAVNRHEREAAEKLLDGLGVEPDASLVVMNPGSAFGSAKCWPPEHFAESADRLTAEGFEVLVVTGPAEREIGETIGRLAKSRLKPAWRANVPLGPLKALISRAALVVTNDSGPRHFAAALGVPVITIIGPTDPRWSSTGWRAEIVLRREVECAPCMLRVCPRDHRCMTLVTPDDVMEAAMRLTGMKHLKGRNIE